MLSRSHFIVIAGATLLSALPGCGASREVEASGSVTSPASTATHVMVAIYDQAKDRTSETRVDQVILGTSNTFSQKVTAEGDKIRIFAFDDTDSNGECTEGENWASEEVRIKDDNTIDPVLLILRSGPCLQELRPKAPATTKDTGWWG